jgi:TPR repeat protein
MKILIKTTLLIACLFCITACAPKKNPSSTSPAQASNLKAGMVSFQKKDYKTAFSILYPLAIQEDDRAEYAIGYMLYYGKAGPANQAEGMNWIRRSAKQGNTLAQRALGIFYAQANMTPEKN